VPGLFESIVGPVVAAGALGGAVVE